MSTSTANASMYNVPQPTTVPPHRVTKSYGSNPIDSPKSKFFRRSRSGCYTCRVRRKKCDEGRPSCGACSSLSVSCEYEKPSWWASVEQRRIHKDRIKNKIRETKMLEKRLNLEEQIRQMLPKPVHVAYDFSRPPAYGSLYEPHLPTPAAPFESAYTWGSGIPTGQPNSLPDTLPLHQPAIASFCTMGMQAQPLPAMSSVLPSDQYQDYVPQPRYSSHTTSDPLQPKRPLSSYLGDTSALDDRERLLLFHFVDDVLRLIFPILDLNPQGPTRAREIMKSLEVNKSYYHCCLSVSAIHRKTSMGRFAGSHIDRDILQHRYKAVSQLSRALMSDYEHDHVLDATLAMIFFHCSVGEPDDYLPDIPWNEHFTAVTNLVNKLGLIQSSPTGLPFSISLTTWIDILGATMLGRSPQFAHNYREKHLNGVSSGLKELMGCDDRIMYLISEIACLDSLKIQGRLDHSSISHHVSALRSQINHTEPTDRTLENPSSPSGTIHVDKLIKIITSLFRTAARIYLYSLIPNCDRDDPSIFNLVEAAADILQIIPSGPNGFDRSLVWPLLVIGAFSTPEGSFRGILAQRATSLGESGNFGSFGRMYRVVQEVWKLADDRFMPEYTSPSMLLPSSDLSHGYDQSSMPYQPVKMIGQPIKKQSVHWRDVMKRLGWHYLLL